MPVPPENRVRFFVFVIESPSAADLYHHRSEGEIIRQAVNLNQIACQVATVINTEVFEASLKVGLVEAMRSLPDLLPIIHISAHGYKEGIQLSSGEVVTWEVLRQLLHPINSALTGNLLVCLSSCESFAGTRMAMFLQDAGYPFFAIVASSGKPAWSETAVAYTTFYHLIAKGEYIIDAVNAMRVASGNDTFFVETAQQSRQVYINYMAGLNAQQVQNQLQQNIEKEEPGHLAKLRKLSTRNKP